MPAYLVTHPPRVRQFRDRGATPSGVIVLHTAESTPDWIDHDTGAENVARFIQGRTDPGSYHRLADSDSRIQLVPYAMQAYGDGTGSNSHAIHLSAATQAAKWLQAPQEWRESTVRNMAHDAVDAARWLKTEHGITVPARRISRAESEARVPGFIPHGDRDPDRRTDPGKDFLWDLFLTTYAAEMGGTSKEDDMQLTDKLYPNIKDSATVSDALKAVVRLERVERRRDEVLRNRIARIRQAVAQNASKVEVEQLLNSLDAEITIVVRPEEK